MEPLKSTIDRNKGPKRNADQLEGHGNSTSQADESPLEEIVRTTTAGPPHEPKTASKKRKINVAEENDEQSASTTDAAEAQKALKKKNKNAAASAKSVHELRRNEQLVDISPQQQNTLRVGDIRGLSPVVVQNLKEQFGIDRFFPIQAQVIPVLLRSIACRGYENLFSLSLSLRFFPKPQLEALHLPSSPFHHPNAFFGLNAPLPPFPKRTNI